MMRVVIAAALLLAAWLPASAGSVEDRNKAVTVDFFQDVLSEGHLDHYARSHAPDFVVHTGMGDLPLAADLAAATEERKALPDMRFDVRHLMAEDDMVLVHWTVSGTNTGDGMGFHATGRTISVSGMTLFRFKAGKISEEWSVFDMLGAYRQAGLIPAK